MEPLSGQFVLNLETRELDERVRVIAERSADDWLAVALEYEADKKTRTEAIEADDCALLVDPAKVDALLNCGTLHYEDGNFEKASEYFTRAISSQLSSALAHFNLGRVLDEAGDADAAWKHLRQVVRLDPNHPHAQYNLAYVGEKLGAFAEAREHWQAYLKLDRAGPWSNYARQRLLPPCRQNRPSTSDYVWN